VEQRALAGMCEKPQVQKADLSYRRAGQRYCSVVRFSANSVGGRKSTARNGCPTGRFLSGGGDQSDLPRLAGGTIPFIRKYSTI
jgi:hypothetical protein